MRVTLFALLLVAAAAPGWAWANAGGTEPPPPGAALDSDAAAPETVAGPAVVIDGDTLRIGDSKIRPGGADAPEMAAREIGGSGERERDFWGWVARYQIGLGAVVGLLGLAVAVWLKGWSTRRRDDRLRD